MLAAILLVVTSAFFPLRPLAMAMELKIAGNQIILSGPVVGDEPVELREALLSSPGIDTVILRNSGGGNAPAGYQSVSCFAGTVSAPQCRAIATPRARGCFSAALVTSPAITCGDHVGAAETHGFHGIDHRTSIILTVSVSSAIA